MSALAQVIALPQKGYRPTVLETLERGQMIWARWPNGNRVGSAFFHPDDAAKLVEQGWIVVDGVRAATCWEYDDCRQTVRLTFESHFREHP
jgi:hypothetical protein